MSTPLAAPPRGGRLLPALIALVTGLLIGAAAVLLFGGQARLTASGPPATATVTVTASPPPPPPGTSRVSVDVPDACLDVARRGGGVAGKVSEAVEAARTLQLDRARRLLAEIQEENPQELAVKAERCRSAIEALNASRSPTPPR